MGSFRSSSQPSFEGLEKNILDSIKFKLDILVSGGGEGEEK